MVPPTELPNDPKHYYHMGKPLLEMSQKELIDLIIFLFKAILEMREDITKIIELRKITKNSETAQEHYSDKIWRENPKDFP